MDTRKTKWQGDQLLYYAAGEVWTVILFLFLYKQVVRNLRQICFTKFVRIMKFPITYYFLISALLVSCDWDLKKIDQPVCDNRFSTIEKSKKLGVFVKEYRPRHVEINDTIKF